MRYLAADVGGTFTDLLLVDIDPATGEARLHLDKVSSRATGSAQGLADGIARLVERAGLAAGDIDLFVHGFTVGTNAFLTRTGARVALVTTEGFRDLLVVGDQQRPHLYELYGSKPAPVAPRSRTVEAKERLDAFGAVVQPLTTAECARVAKAVAALAPESVAVALLFSHLDPAHELMIEAALRTELGAVPVYLSSRVNPEIEEYPRANTTAIAAYVGPVIARYLDAVESKLSAIGVKAPLRLMRGDGGVATPRAARDNPAHLLLSGPAGGVIASVALAKELGIADAVTFDMGGTSADFSLILKGEPTMVGGRHVDGQPLRLPAIDIETISAGGGSIAGVDVGGALKVGPQSAGALPGPACYGLGGQWASVTDACVVLGILHPDEFLGGDIKLDATLAREAVRTQVANPLGLSLEDAAHGILAVATANMCQAIRTLSVERGHDLRGFSLLAFGGAGPIHAAFMARDLSMSEIVAPRYPGVFAASGLLMTDLRHARQMAWRMRLDRTEAQEMARRLNSLRQDLGAQLEQDGVDPKRRYFQFSADMRCVGQFHVLNIPLPAPDRGNGQAWWRQDAIAQSFHLAHERAYGHADRSAPVEIVNLRAHGFGRIDRPAAIADARMAKGQASPFAARKVFMDRAMGWIDTPIYRRDDLIPGHQIHGPAIVIQRDSTILILPNHVGRVDRGGAMRIAPRKEGSAA